MDDKLKKIIERIKKCLALAQSDNPNEAAIAMRQAQKLMQEHNLTESSLHISNVTEHRVIFGNGARRAPQWMNNLADICGRVFDCKVLFVTNRSKNYKLVNYIGIGEAPKMAEYCYEVMLRQLETARKNYCKKLKIQHGYVDRVASNSFALGWVSAIYSKLTELNAKDEAVTGGDKNTLVKASNSIIADYIQRTRGKIDDMEPSKAQRHRAAIYQGYCEGEKANLYAPINDNAEPTPHLLTNN